MGGEVHHNVPLARLKTPDATNPTGEAPGGSEVTPGGSEVATGYGSGDPEQTVKDNTHTVSQTRPNKHRCGAPQGAAVGHPGVLRWGTPGCCGGAPWGAAVGHPGVLRWGTSGCCGGAPRGAAVGHPGVLRSQ